MPNCILTLTIVNVNILKSIHILCLSNVQYVVYTKLSNTFKGSFAAFAKKKNLSAKLLLYKMLWHNLKFYYFPSKTACHFTARSFAILWRPCFILIFDKKSIIVMQIWFKRVVKLPIRFSMNMIENLLQNCGFFFINNP